MGQVKFMLPNDLGIYLHDVPEASKAAFAADDRWISNGCVRLEDAQRLKKWLFRGDPPSPSGTPDERVDLADPVPVYMTYLTAEPTGAGVAFRPDPYNRDAPLLARVKLPQDLQTARSTRPSAAAPLLFAGLGAVVAYSAGVSVRDRSRSAPLNLSIVLTAHSSNASRPSPFLSSLA